MPERILREYAVRSIPLSKWIPGVPAMSGTFDETAWKKIVADAVSSPSSTVAPESISLAFLLVGETSGEQHVSIARLSESVLDVLIRDKGWFSGRRESIRELTVSKTYQTSAAAKSGCRIDIYGAPSGSMTVDDRRARPLLSGVYVLGSATKGAFSDWLKQHLSAPLAATRYAISLSFGSSLIDIANASSGEVKCILEGLYPILGGLDDPAKDWRITSLDLEKNCDEIPDDTVKITIRHGPYPRLELRRGDVLLVLRYC